MRVLYILPFLPIPRNSGNKNLTHGLLKYICEHGDVDLVMLVDSCANSNKSSEKVMRDEFPNIKNIRIFEKPRGWKRKIQRLYCIYKGYHPAMGDYVNQELFSWIKSATKNSDYDIVHFDMMHTIPYFKAVSNGACVLVASDAYSMAAKTARLQSKGFMNVANIFMQEIFFKSMEKKYIQNLILYALFRQRTANIFLYFAISQ